MRRAVSFLPSAVEFDAYRLHLKSVPCPHCRAMGHLNRHGCLRGYAQEGSERVVRGWRLFCSNRGRRRGCGHTHSILLAECLRRRTLRAGQLWQFLEGLQSGLSIKAAWEKLASTFSLECGYRIMRALRRVQSRIRTLLCRIQEPPSSLRENSLGQTIEHLRAVFAQARCPVAAFHLRFQQPLLA